MNQAPRHGAREDNPTCTCGRVMPGPIARRDRGTETLVFECLCGATVPAQYTLGNLGAARRIEAARELFGSVICTGLIR